MGFRYREHLIFPVAYSDPTIGDWMASVHIEFTEKLKIHTVFLKSGDVFQTEVQAKQFIIKEAKKWVDERLRTADPRVKTIRKHSPQLYPGVNKQRIGSVDRARITDTICASGKPVVAPPANPRFFVGAACSRHIKHAKKTLTAKPPSGCLTGNPCHGSNRRT